MFFWAAHQSEGMLLACAVFQQRPVRRKIIFGSQAASALNIATFKCADVAGMAVLLMHVSLEQSNDAEHFLVSLPEVERRNLKYKRLHSFKLWLGTSDFYKSLY